MMDPSLLGVYSWLPSLEPQNSPQSRNKAISKPKELHILYTIKQPKPTQTKANSNQPKSKPTSTYPNTSLYSPEMAIKTQKPYQNHPSSVGVFIFWLNLVLLWVFKTPQPRLPPTKTPPNGLAKSSRSLTLKTIDPQPSPRMKPSADWRGRQPVVGSYWDMWGLAQKRKPGGVFLWLKNQKPRGSVCRFGEHALPFDNRCLGVFR